MKKIKNGNNRFVTGIATSNKSMIPIGLNAQNQVVLLSGNKNKGINPVIDSKTWFPSGVPQTKILVSIEKS